MRYWLLLAGFIGALFLGLYLFVDNYNTNQRAEFAQWCEERGGSKTYIVYRSYLCLTEDGRIITE